MASIYDSDFEIEELQIPSIVSVRPYQFEPVTSHQSQENEEPDSDDESSHSSSDESFDADDDIPNDLQWCTCNTCIIMPTGRECRCCHSMSAVKDRADSKGVVCITQAHGFIANCLDIEVLETSYYEYRQLNGPPLENQQIHEIYRYVAYRRFCRWIWKILGKHNRKILPACVVSKIREQFPSQQYCGFQYPM